MIGRAGDTGRHLWFAGCCGRCLRWIGERPVHPCEPNILVENVVHSVSILAIYKRIP